MNAEELAEFDAELEAPDPEPVDESLLPESLRGVKPPDWWGQGPATTNPAAIAAQLHQP